MKKLVVAIAVAAAAVSSPAEPGKPYTHLNYLNGPEDFRFAILPDVQGADFNGSDYRDGLARAVRAINLLRPDFAISVGDLIPYGWFREAKVRQQHREFEKKISGLVPPFYYVVGNHDIAPSQRSPKGLERANEISTAVWKDVHGSDTYYSFKYKGCLFVALNTIDGVTLGSKHQNISDRQYEWFRRTLAADPDVRWTFIFMHQPAVWTTERWLDFELKNLVNRRYTVFAGDWHQYLHVRRHGRDYYVLSVAGGGAGWSDSRDNEDRKRLKGPAYGEIDHITWVTMTGDGPVIANVGLDGVFAHDFVSQKTTLSLSKANFKWQLDYPVDPSVRKRFEKMKAEQDKSNPPKRNNPPRH